MMYVLKLLRQWLGSGGGEISRFAKPGASFRET